MAADASSSQPAKTGPHLTREDLIKSMHGDLRNFVATTEWDSTTRLAATDDVATHVGNKPLAKPI
jgi:hypothetical protein